MITKVRSRVQDAVDAIVAIALAITGATMIIGYGSRVLIETYARVGAIAWAATLAAGAGLALAGVITRPSGRGVGLELAGWGFVSLAVLLYTLSTLTAGTVTGVAALTALTALLAGKFLRLTGALRTAAKEEANDVGDRQ